jgi:hypothetical protein
MTTLMVDTFYRAAVPLMVVFVMLNVIARVGNILFLTVCCFNAISTRIHAI